MAIIRCPYCHAIIDENDKYCNNCGTQLLFAEDESVEEEIPGDKILEGEADEEEKDYEIAEPGKGTAGLPDEADKPEERTGELTAGPEGETGTKDLGQLLEEEESGEDQEEELPDDEDEAEEVILVDEIAAQEAAAKEEEETRAYAVQPVEKKGPREETAELAAPPVRAEEEEATESRPGVDAAKKEKPDTEEVRTGQTEEGGSGESAPGAEPVPMTFDTQELEGIGRTVDLSKERLDKLVEVMAEKQKEEEPRDETPKPEPEKATGTLPPWAARIRSAASVIEREDTKDVGPGFNKETPAGPGDKFEKEGPGLAATERKPGESEEEEIFPHRKAPDSGIGLPERVTQADLPFGPARGGEKAGEEAGEEETFPPAAAPASAGLPESGKIWAPVREETKAEAGFEKEPEEEEPGPPFRLSVFLKAKAFDGLFIGIFWLVALWVAARSMGATLFELLSVTSGSVLLLYAVFVLLYFFLFKFFLGETLGDRLFKERE